MIDVHVLPHLEKCSVRVDVIVPDIVRSYAFSSTTLYDVPHMLKIIRDDLLRQSAILILKEMKKLERELEGAII